MTYHRAIGPGAREALADALRAEFGPVLAARIIEAEELDFLWDARVVERYVGQHFVQDTVPGDGSECDLSRVAIVSLCDGVWRAAVCVAGGDGDSVALVWERCWEDLGRLFAQATLPDDGSECDLWRVAIVSFFDGVWRAAVCVADGDGDAVTLLWERCCEGRDEALAAFERAV